MKQQANHLSLESERIEIISRSAVVALMLKVKKKKHIYELFIKHVVLRRNLGYTVSAIVPPRLVFLLFR